MKYSEFKNQVNTDIYNISETEVYIFVLNYKGFTLTTVSKKYAYIMSSNSIAFENIKADEGLRLLNLAMALAITPLAEREEEKRYRLLSVSPMLRKSECGYLLYHKSMGRYFTGSAEYGGDVYQAIFTESEIRKMDTTGFEKIEVAE